MTEQILLLNPRRRSRRRAMPAGLKRYWASRRRLSNPRRHRHRTRRANPRRRHYVRAYTERRRNRSVRVRSHLSNPRRYRRHRRNPRENVGSMISDYLVPAGIGAAAAVVLNVGWGYLSPSMPASMQAGIGALATQAGLVIVAGAVLTSALPRSKRGITAGTVGALTVVAYSALSELVDQFTPVSTTVAGLRDYRTYVRTGRPMGAYMANGQPRQVIAVPGKAGVRAPAPARRIGWVSPASPLKGLRGMGRIGAYMTYGQQPRF